MTLIIRHRTVRKAGYNLNGMTALERAVADQFADAAAAFRNSWNANTIREIIRNGSVGQLVDSAPWDVLGGTLAGVSGPLNEALTAAGAAQRLRGVTGYAFDVTDPRSIAYAEAQAGRLVTAVTESTREAIQETITQSFIQQRTVDQTAAALRETVGVTGRGATQLSNAYDKAFADAISGGASEAAARSLADTATSGLRERLVESRAKTIARTEVLRAENAGRYLGWAQAIEEGVVDPESRKEWIAGDCPICEELDGQVVMWDEPFDVDGQELDMPPAHPNCVCTAVLVPSDTALSSETGEGLTDEDGAAAGAAEGQEIADEIGDIQDSAEVAPADAVEVDEYPQDQYDALDAEARSINREIADTGKNYYGWEDDIPEEVRPLVERRAQLERDRIDLQRGFYDDHFVINGIGTGGRGMSREFSSSSLFDEQGMKARDKYVADDAGTLKMNASLRDGRKPTARALSMDTMVAQGAVSQDVAVFRGAVLPADMHGGLQVGAEWTDLGFQSTATGRNTAAFYANERLADGARGDVVVFRYILRGGQTAVDVGYGEIVLPRGSRMRVIGRTVDADGVVHVDAEVILNGHQ